jgi:LmbE family N-acetylglucosaminyl deacetylase
MKLNIGFRPTIVVAALAVVAALLWLFACYAGVGSGAFWIALPFALFYTTLSGLSGFALARIAMIERWMDWNSPGRLLILAPHEDDCVIAAGGLGFRNARLGGAVRIAYLARDENLGLPERRAAEAREAWSVAGLGDSDLQFLDLMPPLESRDPEKLHRAGVALRALIDDFRPTAIVMPAFEGGHIHHDMVAALVDSIVTSTDRFDLFEAPEYSPYVSLLNTPHRILSLAARWLFFVVYVGEPDSVDRRSVLKVRLDPDELAAKRRMLGAFVSQNAPSLVATRSYPDRLTVRRPPQYRRHPFDFASSYLRLALALRQYLPASIVDRLLPVQLGTIGRMGTITDWDAERSASGR